MLESVQRYRPGWNSLVWKGKMNMKKWMIVLLAVLLVILPICGGMAEAQDNIASEDPLIWKLEDETLIISGTGKMEDFSEAVNSEGILITTAPWYDVKDCTRIVVEEGVTTIGDYAFWNKTRVRSITLPESLASIGELAFGAGSFLKEINLPDSIAYIGNNAFASCHMLTSIRLPASLKKIEPFTFYRCQSLLEITIPDSVVSIDFHAFDECTCLEKIVLPPSVKQISSSAFAGCDNLQDIIVVKGSYAERFCMNYNLPYTSVEELPEQQELAGSVKAELSWKVENDTLTISGIGMMEDFKRILSEPDARGNRYPRGTTAPWSQEKFSRVVVEEGITSIGDLAFDGFHTLTSVSLPESLRYIGKEAFYGDTELTAINFPDSVTHIGGRAFIFCNKLKNVVLPASLRFLDYSAFYECADLESVSLPASVHFIYDDVFSKCPNLKHITVVKGSYAEQYCITNDLPYEY